MGKNKSKDHRDTAAVAVTAKRSRIQGREERRSEMSVADQPLPSTSEGLGEPRSIKTALRSSNNNSNVAYSTSGNVVSTLRALKISKKGRNLSLNGKCKKVTKSLVGQDEEPDYDELDRVRVSVYDHEHDEFPYEGQEDEQEEGELDDSDSTTTEVTFKPSAVQRGQQGQKASEVNFESWKGNPAFEKFIKGMVAQELEAERKKSGAGRRCSAPPAALGREPMEQQGTPVRRPDKARGQRGNTEILKSPSDTTIYAPALNKIVPEANQSKFQAVAQNMIVQDFERGDHEQREMQVVNLPTDNISQHVEQFIEGVRLEVAEDQIQPGTSSEKRQPKSVVVAGNDAYAEQLDAAKRKADKLVLDAERFKATVNTPPGNMIVNEIHAIPNNVAQDLNGPAGPMGYLGACEGVIPDNTIPPPLDDDDFFHVSCHVDQLLKNKIERGDFVELDRLLPKPRNSLNMELEQRMNLIQRDGHAYFVPSPGANRIGSVRKWEQAFRIYAAIYSQANPTRAAEIWQYVHVINVAASSYAWDNVSSYDITFRHLMAQNPRRSWAKIYNQMWNMSMRDVLPRTPGTNQNSSFGKHNKSGGRKPKYCWAHQENKCKDGAKCKWVHRCSYCDAGDHVKNNCPKRK